MGSGTEESEFDCWQGQDIFSYPEHTDKRWHPPSLLFNCYREVGQRLQLVKRPSCEPDNVPTDSDAVPLLPSMLARHRHKFNVYLFLSCLIISFSLVSFFFFFKYSKVFSSKYSFFVSIYWRETCAVFYSPFICVLHFCWKLAQFL